MKTFSAFSFLIQEKIDDVFLKVTDSFIDRPSVFLEAQKYLGKSRSLHPGDAVV